MPDDNQSDECQGDNNRDKKPNFLSIVLSTVAAAFGVQSTKNRERDFKHGSIWVFVLSGIIFTVLFIFTVTTVVRIVLSN
jgi:hypothetical protein